MAKAILTLGDSITVGAGAISNGYSNLLAQKLGYTHVNRSVSGCTISTNYSAIKEVDLSQIDIVTIMTGTNNVGSGGLGTIEDVKDNFEENPLTFYGMLGFIADYSRYKNPLINVYFITPPQSGTPSLSILNNIVTAFKEVGKKCSVPVIDVYGESNLLYHNSSIRTSYFADIAHPSQLGHEKIADFVYSKIKSMQTI